MKPEKSIQKILNDFKENEIEMPIDDVANFIQLNSNRRKGRNKIALTLLFLFLGAGILLVKISGNKKQNKLSAVQSEKIIKLPEQFKTEVKQQKVVLKKSKKITKKTTLKKANKINIDHSFDNLVTLTSIDMSNYNDINKSNAFETDISLYNDVNMPIIN